MSISRRDLILRGALTLPAAGMLKDSFASSGNPDSSNPNVEARAAWVHTESYDADPVKGKQQIRTAMQRLADTNLNLILPWTSSGYLVALENSGYQEAHPMARWDALGYLIHEAAQCGLAVHLWYSFTEYRTPSWPDFDPKVGGNPEWAARRIDAVVPDYPIAKGGWQGKEYGNGVTQLLEEPQWLMDAIRIPLPAEGPLHEVCPQHAEARAWQLQLLVKALDRYPELSGIHVEEPGYNFAGYCVCDLCRTAYQQLYKESLVDHLYSLEAQDFRCLGTSAFMAALYRILRKRNLKLQLSTNGSPDWREDQGMRGRAWPHWARMGWLDYYVPQDYEPTLDNFQKQLSLTMKHLERECPVYAGVGVNWSTHPHNIPPQLVVQEIEAARGMGASGIVLFPAAGIDGALKNALLAGPFRSPAKLPLVDHRLQYPDAVVE